MTESLKDAPTESYELRTFANWLELRNIWWCRVPVVTSMANSAAIKARKEGAKSGVPDCLVFTPVPLHPTARGVAIEMRRIRYSAQTIDQGIWQQQLAKNGWLVHIAKGAQDAIAYMQSLGFGSANT